MSIERARKRIKGKQVDRIPLFEKPAHRGFLLDFVGIDPSGETERSISEAIKKLDIDIIAFDIPPNQNIDLTDPNLYDLSPTGWRNAESTSSDIWGFNPLLHSASAFEASQGNVKWFKSILERNMRLTGGTAMPIGFTFTTCIHYASENLDTEEFLISCISEPEKMSALLDSFESASMPVMEYWAKAKPELMICHDDIASSHGLTLGAEWTRKNLIPRYKRLLKPFIDSDIPVLFMTDGNFLEIAEDIANIGVSGFFLDNPCVTLEEIVPLCGMDMIYYTGPAPALMQNASSEDVAKEVHHIANIAKDLPRFFFHMPGGFPHNMPKENVEAYFDACLKYGKY